MGHKKGKKERLKPISFYGHDPRDVIRALMQVSPKRLKELEEVERKRDELDQYSDKSER